MYKHHQIICLIIFFIVATYSYKMGLLLSENFIGNLITFFSIVFGFYLTGLSILFGSNFAKRLGRQEDIRRNTQTMLQTLKAYFNFSSLASLSSIVLLLIMSLLGLTTESESNFINNCLTTDIIRICWDKTLTAAALGLAVVNIMFMILLFKVYFNGFLEEGSE